MVRRSADALPAPGAVGAGPAPPEGRRLALRGEAEEARDDAHATRVRLAPEEGREVLPGLREEGRRVPVVVVRHEADEVRLVGPRVDPPRTEVRAEDPRGDPLPER